MKSALLLSVLLAIHISGYCQSNTTLFEINPGPGHGDPVALTRFNGKLFYYADDGTHGLELWNTDSWSDPHMVYDLSPGGDCIPGTIYIRGKMAELNGSLYYMGSNDTLGYELYRYGGSGKPVITQDYLPGKDGMAIDYLTALKGKLYYKAVHRLYGSELWVYDPANNSMQMIADLNPGPSGCELRDLTVYDNKLYFSAETNSTGNELYVFDPVSNTIQLVADINTGVVSSSPKGMVVIGGALYFSAVSASNGRELYRYAGSGAPTRLTDLNPGKGDGVLAASPVSIGWLYTGVYFAGSNGNSGYQLYKYEPATNQVTLVHNLQAGGNSGPANFCVYINKLFFSADNGINGRELWVYDGTHTPKMVADINAGAGSSFPAELTEINGSLCFNANNGNNGRELYRYTDPAAGMKGTTFDGDISVYPNPATEDLKFNLGLRHAEQLTIRLADYQGVEVYRSALKSYGATVHTISVPVKDLVAGSYFYYLCNEAGAIYSTGRVVK